MNTKTIVLAGDNAYIVQIETTIKSLCTYHEGLDIHVFNQDIPQQWFLATRAHVEQSGNRLHDVKIFHEHLNSKWDSTKLPHINYMTYARYFIPDFIEADTVLYLDCDLVVTTNLDHLFELELGNKPLAAAPSVYGLGLGFNAGVMVINNSLWKQSQASKRLVELTLEMIDEAAEGDQTILNTLFYDDHLRLEDTYNFQIGFDMGAAQYGHDFIFDLPLDPLPKIIHYISGQKPWQLSTNMRLKDVWWFYRNLQWSDIVASKRVNVNQLKTGQTDRLHCFTLTHSDNLDAIEAVIKQVPQALFHIAAPTIMSGNLIKLQAYENVRLYPACLPVTIRQLKETCQVYLDVNHGPKSPELLQELAAAGKPVLAFDHTATEGVDLGAFGQHFADADTLANHLRSLAQEK